MEFRLLGTVAVETYTGPLPLGPAKRRSLLAALLLSANTPVSVGRLTESLWDDTPPSQARGVIQGHVSRLRALLVGADAEAYGVELATLGDAYVLRAPETLVDAQRFEELLMLAREQRSPGDTVLMLKEALSLWQGPALSGAFAGPPLKAAAHSLEESRLATVELLARTYGTLGEYHRAAALLSAETAAHPLRESLAAELMLALYRAGRQSEALDRFHRTRRLLADELGIDPGPKLADAYALILRGDPGPPAAAPAARARVPSRPAAPSAAPSTASTASTGADAAPVAGPPPAAGDTAGAPPSYGVRRPRRSPPCTPQIRSPSTCSPGPPAASRGAPRSWPRSAGRRRASLPSAWSPGRPGSARPPWRSSGRTATRRSSRTGGSSPICAGSAEGEPALIDVLREFLLALGVPPRRVPESAPAAAALFRSLTGLALAAGGPRQRPRLRHRPRTAPGRHGLRHARDEHRLEGLIASDAARPVPLDTLEADDGTALLAGVLGEERVLAEPVAARRLAELCGGLPLALRVTAARLAGRPQWTLAALADELADERGRLAFLDVDDTGVAAALRLTVQHLPPDAVHQFARLGHHPGGHVDPYAAAALAGTDPVAAAAALERLAAAHLVSETAPGRWVLHDLVRLYARGLDPAAAREALVGVLDHGIATALAAADTAEPGGEPCFVLPDGFRPRRRTGLLRPRGGDALAVRRAGESGARRPGGTGRRAGGPGLADHPAPVAAGGVAGEGQLDAAAGAGAGIGPRGQGRVRRIEGAHAARLGADGGGPGGRGRRPPGALSPARPGGRGPAGRGDRADQPGGRPGRAGRAF